MPTIATLATEDQLSLEHIPSIHSFSLKALPLAQACPYRCVPKVAGRRFYAGNIDKVDDS